VLSDTVVAAAFVAFVAGVATRVATTRVATLVARVVAVAILLI
jgi:hypothetical protein